ncbi:hypothetical protein D3C86_2093290 [compost metagenome]
MFNAKNPEQTICNGSTINHGEPSYIKTVKWKDFMSGNSFNGYINTAVQIRDNKQAYKLYINMSKP